MSKALVSFALNKEYTDLLKIALPTHYQYAHIHQYDLIAPSYSQVLDVCNEYGWEQNRPSSWLKIPIIKSLLKKYDTVLWLDCDTIINKFDLDISNEFDKSNCIQAFVTHNDKYVGNVENMGVWILKQSAIKLLDDIWSQTDYIDHVWWEQAANIHLMKNDSDLKKKSYNLPYECNIHKNDIRFNQNWEKEGRILHATMWPDRLSKMKEWANNI